MDNIADVVGVSYSGGNAIVKKLIAAYDRVINYRYSSMRGAEESQLWAVSASALFDLSRAVLQPEVPRVIGAEILGIKDESIEHKKPEVYEAVQFICSQILERWEHALGQHGYNSTNLSRAIGRIRSGRIRTTRKIVELVNEYEGPALALINFGDLTPREGWTGVLQILEHDRLVMERKIHTGQYL